MRELLAILIAACAITTSANAAEFRHYGNEILAIVGAIAPGDTSRLYEMVAEMREQGEEIRVIAIDSAGGDMDEGIGIANFARAAQVGVVVGPTSKCASMCMLIFAAGKARMAGPESFLGVHSVVSYNKAEASDDIVPWEDATAMASTTELARRMADYGTPASIIAKLVTTRGDDIAQLDMNDLDGWVFVTESNQTSPASQATIDNFLAAIGELEG